MFAHAPFGIKREHATASLRQSLALYRALDDRWGEAVVLLNLGGLAWDEGGLRDAERQYEASLDLFRAYGDERGVTTCLHALHESQEAHRACERDAEMLRVALRHSRDIGTAIGILMSRHKITADAAFDLLRAASQRTNRKVRDLAVAVVDTGALL